MNESSPPHPEAPPNHPTDNEVSRFKDLISEVQQCCQAKTAFLSKTFGIPQAELRLLMLFQDERYLTAKGVGRRLDVAKSRVTKIVQGLADRGLVELVEDPRDARVRLISLTARGRITADELARFNAELHRMILQSVEPDRRLAVLSSLDTLRASMEHLKAKLMA